MSDINNTSMEAMQAELAKLKAENDSLKHKAATKGDRVRTANGLTLAVGKAGGLCIYGLGRFPVTLFLSQYTRIAEASPEIVAFIQANLAKFAVKPAKEVKGEESEEVAA